MYYLYGSKQDGRNMLVARFDSEQQLRAYVRWATLFESRGVYQFEQASELAGCRTWAMTKLPLTDGDGEADVAYNPSPSML